MAQTIDHSRIQSGEDKANVLLVTVKKVEAQAVLSIFEQELGSKSRRFYVGHKTYYDIGVIGEARVFMVRSETGSGGPSGSQTTIHTAIQDLSPSAIVMVGIAFGVSQNKQQIGDILVSHQLQQYERQRVGTDSAGELTIVPRGELVGASPRLLDRFRDGELDWDGPKLRFGLVLSGEKMVDNLGFRDQLLKLWPGAIGGEMEGEGLHAAVTVPKIDWILVKAICDWADGKKHKQKQQRQEQAARNAAIFTLYVLKRGGFANASKDLRQLHEIPPTKNLLKSYSQVMEIEAEQLNPLLDWPILRDLKSGKESEVYVDEDKLHEINQKLTNPQNRRILIKGLGGRGKTVLSRLYAYKKRQNNWVVYFIDLRELGSFDTDIGVVIEQIKNTIMNCNVKSLFIVENAHLYDDIAHNLVKSADLLVMNEQYINSHFLFNSRDIVRDKDLDPFSNWRKKGLFSLVSPDSKVVEEILNQFIDANHIEYTLSQADRDWIKTTIVPIQNSEGTQLGGDLRLLRLYLIAWRYNANIGLCDLQDNDVTKSLKKFLLVEELPGEVALADVLGKVSSIFQFDVPFYARRTGWSNSKNYITDLEALRNKGRIKCIGTDFYTLTHSLDAHYITMCLADHNEQTHSQYTGNRIVEYISELPNQPANIIVENIVQLFRAFYDSQQDFEKEVFIYIFSNARNKIVEIITEYCEGLGDPGRKYHEGLGILSRILNLVETYLGKREAVAFWRRIYIHIKPEAWREIFTRNKPFYIALLIQIIDRISPEDEQDSEKFRFLFDSFAGIYESSDLHRLEEIFRPLPRSVVKKLQGKMSPSSFASKIIESKPIYLEFVMKQLEEGFLREVFHHIWNHRWDEFLVFFRKLEGKNYPKSLFDRIRAIDAKLADNLQIELKSFFEDLKIQNRKRSMDGRLLINNKIANNYANKSFNNDDFRKYLSANFEDNFVITISNPKVVKRLLMKIFYSTHRFLEKEQGENIITQIIYQLSDEVLRELCSDSKLLGIIEDFYKTSYGYLCNKCRDLY